ncbi:MAG: DUF2797 domain-containing protein [Endozoicomonas sp. (ex Botrylloides leachii)]|nr:DUF2797 domain-containing protein [Endozoicomonas sp. (ex Botrylloides leachii)]
MSAIDPAKKKILSGSLSKMSIAFNNPIDYNLVVGDQKLSLNKLLGQKITLEYLGVINCRHCGRRTKKSFNQGFCYPCFRKLPQCDICILSPEKCHYDQGTCRDEQWGEQFCMVDHIVYLANSSGLKVGITRASQMPVRWIDQGAIQALPIFKVATRYQSGLLEILFKGCVSDRTNWRTMLKGSVERINLKQKAKELLDTNQTPIEALQAQFGLNAIQPIIDMDEWSFEYPVKQYPTKVISQSFDKTPMIDGVLLGIKGQYLILDSGVLNIRKHTAYQIRVSVH